MLLTNHTLTGVVIGLTLTDPYLAVPAGIASHLVLDIIPHYGPAKAWGWRDSRFLIVGGTDFVCSAAITVTAAITWPEHAPVIIAAIFGAALPDLTYIPLIVFTQERVIRWLPWYRPMLVFLASIQTYERPPGLIVEVGWALCASGAIWLLTR